jgi:hypothetical protein
MKKYLIILLTLMSFLPGKSFAQDDQHQPVQENKIQERMREYIQNRLSLSRNEAEKFTPLFIKYFREFAQTHRSYRGDRLVLQQKIIELRLHYRTEFRQVMDEQRANKVFKYEDEFRQEAVRILKENRRDRIDKPVRRDRSILMD